VGGVDRTSTCAAGRSRNEVEPVEELDLDKLMADLRAGA